MFSAASPTLLAGAGRDEGSIARCVFDDPQRQIRRAALLSDVTFSVLTDLACVSSFWCPWCSP